jgi:MoxR-vWA-beta-propeller ternary system domain bpX2
VKNTDVTTAWKEVRCASMRADDLRVLADLRGRVELRVLLAGDRAWLCWPADMEMIPEVLVGRILPLEGVELFTERDGLWYRLGEHLPAFNVPFRDGVDGDLLDRLLIPGKLSAQRPERQFSDALCAGLVRDDREVFRPATALRCSLPVLCVWAEQATSFQLASLQGAWRVASDGEKDEDAIADAFLLGAAGELPLLPESVRYWGTDLLIPVGFRADPDLPEGTFRRVVGAGPGDLVVLDEAGFELIARNAFKPLYRGGIRLARGGFSRPWPREGSPI